MTEPSITGCSIIEFIGQGASSEVYKARQLSSGRIVAVKVVRRASSGGTRHFKQIANEFKVARQWTHPNLVRLYELVSGRLLLWKLYVALIMEYVPGETLASGQKRTTAQIVDLYMQLADGMGYMHQKGYVHLDMKPQNVIVTPEGEAKIMDFGLCTKGGKYNPRVQGTPDFMAPEQLRKGWVDERTDIYNLGATMYHVVTGKSVQMTLTSRQGQNGLASVTSETFQSLKIEMPPELESLILQSCRPGPSERPATMQRVCETLQSIRDMLTGAQVPG